MFVLTLAIACAACSAAAVAAAAAALRFLVCLVSIASVLVITDSWKVTDGLAGVCTTDVVALADLQV